MECSVANRKLVPLSKVVKASIVDTYDDIGRMEQRFSHWAARGLQKLQREVLARGKKRVMLTVNQNTHTATLPLDFDEECFLGVIDERGYKVAMKSNNAIPDSMNIEVPPEDACPTCAQNKNICNELVITEDTTLIVINSSTYEQTVTKKLYPNGDYYLETSTPVLNIETDDIDYNVTKEFIVNLDLLPCGCLDASQVNVAKVQCFCPDVYCTYYAPCDRSCTVDYGSYRVFEDSGLIQFDQYFKLTQVYMEYWGFIPKRNGQYMVPLVAFETLVEWTKFKAIANKKGVLRWERKDQFDHFKRERDNMTKIMGRVRLSQIIQAIGILPKFDWDHPRWYGCFTPVPALLPVSTDDCANASGNGNGNNSTTIINNYINRTSFTLAVKVDGNPGSPVDGLATYQNNVLKNALDVNYIFAAKGIETIKDGDFTFDPVTGIIDRSPKGNKWVTGDTLIVNYNKNL